MSWHLSKTLFLGRQYEQYFSNTCVRFRIRHGNDLRPSIACEQSRSVFHPNQTQKFSTSKSRRAEDEKKDGVKRKDRKTMKMEKMMKEMQKKPYLQNQDTPMLPDFFIMPSGKNLPSWRANFKGRWLLEKKRLWTWITETGSALFWKYFHVRPRPKLNWRQVPTTVEELHKSMYTNFALNDQQALDPILTNGMMRSLRARIAERPPNTELRWDLQKYISRSKLMSWRAASPPVSKGEKKTERQGIIQAVVRIHSLQSLQNIKRKGRGDTTKGKIVNHEANEIAKSDAGDAQTHAKEVVEYVVVQQILKNSRPGPWKIWGTTEETRLEALQSAPAKSAKRDAKPTKGDANTAVAST